MSHSTVLLLLVSSCLGHVDLKLRLFLPIVRSITEESKGALRRVLAAYALHNPTVGYCQGMNFIAGCLLLFMGEEDTFYCMAVIVEDILPGYFSQAMLATQVRLL